MIMEGTNEGATIRLVRLRPGRFYLWLFSIKNNAG